MRLGAIITGDIVNSTKLPVEGEELIIAYIKRYETLIYRNFNKFEVIKL